MSSWSKTILKEFHGLHFLSMLIGRTVGCQFHTGPVSQPLRGGSSLPSPSTSRELTPRPGGKERQGFLWVSLFCFTCCVYASDPSAQPANLWGHEAHLCSPSPARLSRPQLTSPDVAKAKPWSSAPGTQASSLPQAVPDAIVRRLLWFSHTPCASVTPVAPSPTWSFLLEGECRGDGRGRADCWRLGMVDLWVHLLWKEARVPETR